MLVLMINFAIDAVYDGGRGYTGSTVESRTAMHSFVEIAPLCLELCSAIAVLVMNSGREVVKICWVVTVYCGRMMSPATRQYARRSKTTSRRTRIRDYSAKVCAIDA